MIVFWKGSEYASDVQSYLLRHHEHFILEIMFWVKSILSLHKLHYHSLRFAEAIVRRCSVKKVYLEISQISQENTCARDSRRATVLKNRLWHRCFPVNFAKFLRTPFTIEQLWWLLLDLDTDQKRFTSEHESSRN